MAAAAGMTDEIVLARHDGGGAPGGAMAGGAATEVATGEPAATVRLGPGLGVADLALGASDCGQYLMLTCGGELVALIGAMGSDVEAVEFADGARYRVEELMDRVAG